MSSRQRRSRRASLLLLSMLVVSCFGASNAGAAAPAPPTELGVTTPYPVVDTQPGSTVTFDLTVRSPVAQTVELAVSDVEPTWSATLRGGGFVIGAVTAAPDAPGEATIEIDVPPDAAPGAYSVVVDANAADGSDASLEMTINIETQVDNGVQVTADFPSLSGEADSDFSFNLTITNNTPEEQTFTFSPRGPQGWTVSASPTAEARAATITIEAGASSDVKVTATPPESTEQGRYDIIVGVTASNGAEGSITLNAEVTGTPELSLATADQRLDTSGRSNSEKRLPLIVANTGSAPLESVQLAGTAPSDWEISFDPQVVDAIQPGDTRQVTAIIKPAAGSVAGDYAMTLRASAGSQSSQIELRFELSGERTLGFVAIAVIVVAVLGLVGVFWRFGRR